MAEFIPSNTSTTEIEAMVEAHRHSKLAEIANDYNATLDRENLNLRITPAKYTSLQLIFVLITRGIYDIPEELTADLIPHPEEIIGALSSSRYEIGQGSDYELEVDYDVIPGIYYLYIHRYRLRPYLLATVPINTFLDENTYDGYEALIAGLRLTGNNSVNSSAALSVIIKGLNPDGLFILATSLDEQASIFEAYAGIDNFIEIVKDL
jgi:hypothetical protein